LIDCFEIQREGEAEIFNPKKLGNRKLLWHGSRFSNFVGILSQGMRIAPPEAPKTGYLFGKGVYFADLIGKSTPYCRPELSNGIATFVLCEVALGVSQTRERPDCNADILPEGIHSTMALGQYYPDRNQSRYIEDGLEIPLGQVKHQPSFYMRTNEFIVYDKTQIKMRYLVRTQVHSSY